MLISVFLLPFYFHFSQRDLEFTLELDFKGQLCEAAISHDYKMRWKQTKSQEATQLWAPAPLTNDKQLERWARGFEWALWCISIMVQDSNLIKMDLQVRLNNLQNLSKKFYLSYLV